MATKDKTQKFENINGIPLFLKIESRNGSSKSKQFTISYRSNRNASNWPVKALFMALVFNAVALAYVAIDITSIVVIVTVVTVLMFIYMTRSVQSEILLVIPTVGIQSSINYAYGKEDKFIPWTSIDDIIINEVIKLNRVLYYLTVLVKTTNQNNPGNENIKVMTLFKYTKPRLPMLEKIYSELQTLLVETPLKDKGSGDIG